MKTSSMYQQSYFLLSTADEDSADSDHDRQNQRSIDNTDRIVVEIEGHLEEESSMPSPHILENQTPSTCPRRRFARRGQSRSACASPSTPSPGQIKSRISFECHADAILEAIAFSCVEGGTSSMPTCTARSEVNEVHARRDHNFHGDVYSMVSLIEDDINNMATNGSDSENTTSILSHLDEAILKEAGRGDGNRRNRRYRNIN